MNRQLISLTSQLVQTDLDLKGCISVFSVDLQVLLADKGNLLVGGLSTQHITKRDVLETLSLADIVIVGAV